MDAFIKSLKVAEEKAKEGYIVRLGIKPTKPETGYGYIKLSSLQTYQPIKAIRFIEKPNLKTAISYLESGSYVWNSGIFIFKYSVMLKELETYIPNHIKIINEFKDIVDLKIGLELTEIVRPYFKRFELISIDFAFMEKSNLIMCIPVDFRWNDIGGFNALEEVFEKDGDLNIINNSYYVQIDSSNNIVLSDDKKNL